MPVHLIPKLSLLKYSRDTIKPMAGEDKGVESYLFQGYASESEPKSTIGVRTQ